MAILEDELHKEKLILKNVNIEGCDGEAIVADNVDKIERD